MILKRVIRSLATYFHIIDATDATKIGILKVVGQALIFVKPNGSEVDITAGGASGSSFSLTPQTITDLASATINASSDSNFNITYSTTLGNTELTLYMTLPWGTAKQGMIKFKNTSVASVLTSLKFIASYNDGTAKTSNAFYVNNSKLVPTNYQLTPSQHDIISYFWDGAGELSVTYGNLFQQPT